MNDLPKNILKKVKKMQQGEVNSFYLYEYLAKKMKDENNKKILLKIAKQEKAHFIIWEGITNVKMGPSKFLIFVYKILNVVLGFTFALKLMEKSEDKAQADYDMIKEYLPVAADIAIEEHEHEKELLSMLDEERLNYIGSIVLGLNDALVELTGTIAGLTLAFADSKMITLSAIITGIAASLSMASSEYLSSKADGNANSLKSSIYTGIAYIITVIFLVLPYILIPNNHFLSLGIMIGVVILIIFFFNYYISVAKDLDFKKKFFQMVLISLGVSIISFGIGYLVKTVIGIDL